MFFSVLIPVYNAENYLRECLDSVQKQTFDDFEVILADDGSTDKSGDICDEYAQNDTRFKVLHLENGGAVRARKNALYASSGRLHRICRQRRSFRYRSSRTAARSGLARIADIAAFGYQLFDANGVLLKNKNAPRAASMRENV